MSTCYEYISHFSAIYLVLFAILFFIEGTFSTNTLTIAQLLTHNETLISAENEFILGFFSPGKSNNVFFGIWFNVSPTQYIWIANRESPLNDTSGVVRIGEDGNLVVLDRAEKIIWSSGVKNLSSEGVVAQILGTGNLVLRNGDGESSVLWQSFDYPSHALVAEMKLGWDLRRGLNRNLTSWRSSDDPSIGEYTYGFDLYGVPQLFIWKGGAKRYRSGPWNGADFGGITSQAKLPFGSEAKVDSEEVYYEHHLSGNSSLMVAVMSDTGVYQVFQRDKTINEWRSLVKAPLDFCGEYMYCGINTVCSLSVSQPCNCITGYTPVNQREWSVGIWSGGCKLEKALNCSEMVKFEEHEDLKMPDFLQFKVNTSMSLIECEAECLRNCSCTAYANSNVTGNKHGCLLWFGDLVDVRKLLSRSNQTLFVRVSAQPPEIDSRNKKKVVIIVIPTIAAILLLLVVSILFWKQMSRRKAGEKLFGQGGDEETTELPFLDVIVVSKATQNFNVENRIGEGGFGPVYKGKLPNGQEIAVKRLSESSSQGINEFKNEVMLIAKLQHRNLVRLLGYCIHSQEKMLIYEYMPNGSLDSYIFGSSSFSNSHLLVWRRRFDIIVGIARGLLYLHRDSRLRIIHRDLKASNVLLDNELNPKISDFGMARTFGEGELAVKTRRVVGTYGYMAPEYAIDGIYSMKSDVFSFGVLVLEVVSGKKNNQFQHQDHDFNLLGHAWKLWLEGKASELIDPLMEDAVSMSEVIRCIQVGLLCVQHRPDDRPTMSSLLSMLDSETAALPQPNHPGYFTERVITDPNTSSAGTVYSSNDVTNTMIQGR